MLMRYHPGLAVGHTYHKSTSESSGTAAAPRDLTPVNEPSKHSLELDLCKDLTEIADSNSDSEVESVATPREPTPLNDSEHNNPDSELALNNNQPVITDHDSDSQSLTSSNAPSMDSMDRGWEHENEMGDNLESEDSGLDGNDFDDNEFVELHEMYND